MTTPTIHVGRPAFQPVYRSLNQPLTLLGVERRLFLTAVFVSFASFNFFGSFLGGVMMFGVLFSAARAATGTDPQILHVLMRSSRLKAAYDPGKRPARVASEKATS